MRGNHWTRNVGVVVACAEAMSLVAIRRSAKKARLLDDEGASHLDMAQSTPLVAPMHLVRNADAPLRRAAR
jgi:hypothetical protein